MMIDLGGIGALISALTGLLVAAGSVLLQRQRKSAVNADEVEDELDVRTRQFQASLRHIRELEDDRALNTDLPPLERPAELRPDYYRQQQARTAGGRRSKHGAGAGGGAEAG